MLVFFTLVEVYLYVCASFKGWSIATAWHLGKDLQVKDNKHTVFSTYGNRKNTCPPMYIKSSKRLRSHANTVPIELQIYTKCSGHETLERLWKQRLDSSKKYENQQGHCGRRDLVFGWITFRVRRLPSLLFAWNDEFSAQQKDVSTLETTLS